MNHAPFTVQAHLREATELLAAANIENPRLEAQLMLAHSLRCSREDLAREPERIVSEQDANLFQSGVHQRANHHPLGYITGERWFYGRLFRVSPAVLIPRPETEMLVEFALDHCGGDSLIADIGTGSGCIAISIAAERPTVNVHAIDIASDALAVAIDNASMIGVTNRVTFKLGDLYEPLGELRYDIILSNPPYIVKDEVSELMPEVRDFEPAIALWQGAGDDGLTMYRRLMDGAGDHLKPGGWIAVEVGLGQAKDVAEMAANANLVDIEICADFAGIDRVVAARKAL